jgi:hypothetical protein
LHSALALILAPGPWLLAPNSAFPYNLFANFRSLNKTNCPMTYVLRDSFRFAKSMNMIMTVFAVICLLYFIIPIIFGLVLRSNPDVFIVYQLLMQALPFLLLGAAVAYAAFFFLWLQQATVNLRALHMPALNYTPMMAILWFFIPLANIVVPFFILSEVVRASDPVTDLPGKKIPWHFNPAPGNLLALWLGLQICFFLFSYRVLLWYTTGEAIMRVNFLIALAFLGFFFFLMNQLVSIAGNVSRDQIQKYKAILNAQDKLDEEAAALKIAQEQA